MSDISNKIFPKIDRRLNNFEILIPKDMDKDALDIYWKEMEYYEVLHNKYRDKNELIVLAHEYAKNKLKEFYKGNYF